MFVIVSSTHWSSTIDVLKKFVWLFGHVGNKIYWNKPKEKLC